MKTTLASLALSVTAMVAGVYLLVKRLVPMPAAIFTPSIVLNWILSGIFIVSGFLFLLVAVGGLLALSRDSQESGGN